MALWPLPELKYRMACMKQVAGLWLYNSTLINCQETYLRAALALPAAAGACLVPPSVIWGGRGGGLHLEAGEPGFPGNTFSAEMLSRGMREKFHQPEYSKSRE